MQTEQGHLFIEAARSRKRRAYMQLPKSAVEISAASPHRCRRYRHFGLLCHGLSISNFLNTPTDANKNCCYCATLIFTLLCNRASFGDGAQLECCSNAIGRRETKKTDHRRALLNKASREAWGLKSRAIARLFYGPVLSPFRSGRGRLFFIDSGRHVCIIPDHATPKAPIGFLVCLGFLVCRRTFASAGGRSRRRRQCRRRLLPSAPPPVIDRCCERG